MAELLSDADVGLAGPTRQRIIGGTDPNFPRVSDELQASRNRDAAIILQRAQADPNTPADERQRIQAYIDKNLDANPWRRMGGDPAPVAARGGTAVAPSMSGAAAPGQSGLLSDSDVGLGGGAAVAAKPTATKPAGPGFLEREFPNLFGKRATESKRVKTNAWQVSDLNEPTKPMASIAGIDPTIMRTQDIGGSAMQLSDMFTSVLGGIYSHFGFITGNTIALAAGENKQVAAETGKQFAAVLPETMIAPYGHIMSSMGPNYRKFYEENPVGRAMEWFSRTITEGSEKLNKETGVPAQWFEQAASSVMAGFGFAGTMAGLAKSRPGVMKSLKTGLTPTEVAAVKRAAEQKVAEVRMAAELAAAPKPEAEFRTPAQESVRELLVPQEHIRAAQIGQKFEKASEEAQLEAGQAAQNKALGEITATPETLRGTGQVDPAKLAEVKGEKTLQSGLKSDLDAGLDALSERLNEMVVGPKDLRSMMRGERAPAKAADPLTPQNGPSAGAQPQTVTLNGNIYEVGADGRWRKQGPAPAAAAGPQARQTTNIGGRELEVGLGEGGRLAVGGAAARAPGPPGVGQWGAADPRALAATAAVGIGVAAGAVLGDDSVAGAVAGGAAGLGAAAMMGGRGSPGPSARGQGGWVKQPGGNWDPRVAEGLAAPFKEALVPVTDRLLAMHPRAAAGDPGAAAIRSRVDTINTFVDRITRNYVNKYLGTERDPLRDVPVQTGTGTHRWETLTDEILHQLPRKSTDTGSPNAWTTRAFRAPAAQYAINRHLDHVADFAATLDPKKLLNYDFARIVRESAANDVRVAQEAAKSWTQPNPTRIANNDALPTFKAYEPVQEPARKYAFNKPDSVSKVTSVDLPAEQVTYAWKEVVVPGKLTPEQAKQVRPIQAKEPFGPDQPPLRHSLGDKFVALDAKGKPIMDNFSRQAAAGATPEAAWTAGRLAEIGNAMGHCVGSYCGHVASGAKRIFALRDQMGRDYVTVEVVPNSTKARVGDTTTYVKQPDNIAQIKGPGNGPPADFVLDKVQDFVRSQKWGAIGDFDNTGLYRGEVLQAAGSKTAVRGENYTHQEATQHMQHIPDWVGYTDDAGKPRFPQGPGRNQAGATTQDMMQKLGAVGLAGLAGTLWLNDHGNYAVATAIASAALGSRMARARLLEGIEKVDYGLGMMSTRLRNVTGGAEEPYSRSTPIHRRQLQYEYERTVNTFAQTARIVPWMKEVAKLPSKQIDALDAATFANDPKAITAVNKGNPAIVDAWREVRNTFIELGNKAVGLGRFKELLDDYFPRRVKDFDGLMESLHRDVKTKIETVLAEAEARALRTRKQSLTDIERDAILNRELRGYALPQTIQPGYAKSRSVVASEKTRPFYHTMQESAVMTIAEVVKDLETAKFFGKDLIQGQQGGRTYINVDNSIGAMLGSEMRAGKLKPGPDYEMAESLLQSRFGPGELTPNKFVGAVRDLTYGTTLTNIVSAASQLGGPFMTLKAQGIWPTMYSAAQLFTGNAKVTMKTMGLAEHIAEDLSRQSIPGGRAANWATGGGAVGGAALGAWMADDPLGAVPGAFAGAFTSRAVVTGTAEALNRAMKTGTFTFIDMLDKNIYLGAAKNKLERAAMKDEAQLKEWYGTAFGKDYAQLVADLKAGKTTDLTRTALFIELSRSHVTSRMETSQAYADNPNARFLFTLKSYAMKQADMQRNESYNVIKAGLKKGDYKMAATGLVSLAAIATAMTAGNAGPQFIKDFLLGRKTDFQTNDIYENALKTFGLSNYVREKVQEGQWGVVKAIGNTVLPPWEVFERIIAKDPRAVASIPTVGPLYESWELDGRFRHEARRALQAKKEGREFELSEGAQAYKQNKRDAARAKREAAQEAR